MKPKIYYLTKMTLAGCFLFVTACSGASTSAHSPKTVLVGSTPGSDLIKSLFSIDAGKPIDFVRWDLVLDRSANASGSYVLNIAFGEGQPNTNGFKGGGETNSFEGTYTISRSRSGEVYKLTGSKLQGTISILRLNDNLFHLLTPDNKLLSGTGGWSFTLNKRNPSANGPSEKLASWMTGFQDDTSAEVIFVGRTPCAEFASLYNLTLERECNKLKWKLTLFRDPETKKPTKYALQRTLERSRTSTGNWALLSGAKANPEALILRLDPDKPDEAISFLLGDENVLFFMDKKSHLLTGNSDFSYTLNRQMK